jgi:hypothetical protein
MCPLGIRRRGLLRQLGRFNSLCPKLDVRANKKIAPDTSSSRRGCLHIAASSRNLAPS